MDYQSWPTLEDPWIYQPQHGHLHLFGENRVVTANYYDWTQTVNTRPIISENASITTPAASPIEIDLAARIADA